MSGVTTFDYTTQYAGTPQEQDVVTVNRVPFAVIWREPDGQRMHIVREFTPDSRKGAEIGRWGSHATAFEQAMAYALREGIGQ